MEVGQRDGLVAGRAAGVGFGQGVRAVHDLRLHPAFDQVEHLGGRARRQAQGLARSQHQRIEAQDVLGVAATGLRVDVGDLHGFQLWLVGGQAQQRGARLSPG